MSDPEIVQGLLNRDNDITKQFLYSQCRPLFLSIFKVVFSHPVDYDEMIAEFYGYLMDQDGHKLRNFQYKSSVYQWIKVVATRFFISYRDKYREGILEENFRPEEKDTYNCESLTSVDIRIDIDNLLSLMNNPRFVETIRELVLNDRDPKELAKKLGVTTDNLYNIKKRALQALAQIAAKYYSYGR